MHGTFHCRVWHRLLALAVSLWTVPAPGAEALAERLRALAAAHGFRLQGIEKVGPESAVTADGDLGSQLRLLLAGYDHVVDGVPPSVRRVIIVGPRAAPPAGMVIETERRHGHHLVTARLRGVGGHGASIELIVDTGASTLVLPESMMATLGFRGEELEQRPSQTANGAVTGRAARLASVAVGSAVAEDVAVLFVADERLGGVSLLGMSFLERYSVTLDEVRSALVLTPR